MTADFEELIGRIIEGYNGVTMQQYIDLDDFTAIPDVKSYCKAVIDGDDKAKAESMEKLDGRMLEAIEVLYSRIEDLSDEEIDRYSYGDGANPYDGIKDMTADDVHELRLSVAGSKEASPEVLRRLSVSEDADIRVAAATTLKETYGEEADGTVYEELPDIDAGADYPEEYWEGQAANYVEYEESEIQDYSLEDAAELQPDSADESNESRLETDPDREKTAETKDTEAGAGKGDTNNADSKETIENTEKISVLENLEKGGITLEMRTLDNPDNSDKGNSTIALKISAEGVEGYIRDGGNKIEIPEREHLSVGEISAFEKAVSLAGAEIGMAAGVSKIARELGYDEAAVNSHFRIEKGDDGYELHINTIPDSPDIDKNALIINSRGDIRETTEFSTSEKDGIISRLDDIRDRAKAGFERPSLYKEAGSVDSFEIVRDIMKDGFILGNKDYTADIVIPDKDGETVPAKTWIAEGVDGRFGRAVSLVEIDRSDAGEGCTELYIVRNENRDSKVVLGMDNLPVGTERLFAPDDIMKKTWTDKSGNTRQGSITFVDNKQVEAAKSAVTRDGRKFDLGKTIDSVLEKAMDKMESSIIKRVPDLEARSEGIAKLEGAFGSVQYMKDIVMADMAVKHKAGGENPYIIHNDEKGAARLASDAMNIVQDLYGYMDTISLNEKAVSISKPTIIERGSDYERSSTNPYPLDYKISVVNEVLGSIADAAHIAGTTIDSSTTEYFENLLKDYNEKTEDGKKLTIGEDGKVYNQYGLTSDGKFNERYCEKNFSDGEKQYMMNDRRFEYGDGIDSSRYIDQYKNEGFCELREHINGGDGKLKDVEIMAEFRMIDNEVKQAAYQEAVSDIIDKKIESMSDSDLETYKELADRVKSDISKGVITAEQGVEILDKGEYPENLGKIDSGVSVNGRGGSDSKITPYKEAVDKYKSFMMKFPLGSGYSNTFVQILDLKCLIAGKNEGVTYQSFRHKEFDFKFDNTESRQEALAKGTDRYINMGDIIYKVYSISRTNIFESLFMVIVEKIASAVSDAIESRREARIENEINEAYGKIEKAEEEPDNEEKSGIEKNEGESESGQADEKNWVEAKDKQDDTEEKDNETEDGVEKSEDGADPDVDNARKDTDSKEEPEQDVEQKADNNPDGIDNADGPESSEENSNNIETDENSGIESKGDNTGQDVNNDADASDTGVNNDTDTSDTGENPDTDEDEAETGNVTSDNKEEALPDSVDNAQKDETELNTETDEKSVDNSGEDNNVEQEENKKSDVLAKAAIDEDIGIDDAEDVEGPEQDQSVTTDDGDDEEPEEKSEKKETADGKEPDEPDKPIDHEAGMGAKEDILLEGSDSTGSEIEAAEAIEDEPGEELNNEDITNESENANNDKKGEKDDTDEYEFSGDLGGDVDIHDMGQPYTESLADDLKEAADGLKDFIEGRADEMPQFDGLESGDKTSVVEAVIGDKGSLTPDEIDRTVDMANSLANSGDFGYEEINDWLRETLPDGCADLFTDRFEASFDGEAVNDITDSDVEPDSVYFEYGDSVYEIEPDSVRDIEDRGIDIHEFVDSLSMFIDTSVSEEVGEIADAVILEMDTVDSGTTAEDTNNGVSVDNLPDIDSETMDDMAFEVVPDTETVESVIEALL